jgi:hypothetical protein
VTVKGEETVEIELDATSGKKKKYSRPLWVFQDLLKGTPRLRGLFLLNSFVKKF